MSAQDLSFAELLGATAPLGIGGSHRAFFEGSRVGALYRDELDELRALIAPAPSRSLEDERITAELSATDADHDRQVRFADGLLAVHAEHHHDPSVRADAAELRALLFPDGALLVNRSYAEEAGRGAARDAALSPEVRARLARYAVGTIDGVGLSLATWIDEQLQVTTARLSELLAARTSVGATSGPTPAALLGAKRKLTALYTELLGTFRRDRTLSDADGRQLDDVERAWRDAVQGATDRAARRRAGPRAPTDVDDAV